MASTTAALSSFGTVNHIDAGVLNVGYVDAGPSDGPAVVLLHGWPYDIHSYVDVAPLLAAAGHRVIVPHLRGFGTTRFLSDATVRNGEQAAIALDTVALMDALGIERAVLGGCDWGARTADIVAALWPERGDDVGRARPPVISGQDRVLDPEGVHQADDVVSDRRLFTAPERVGVEEPRRTVAAQMGDDHPVSGRAEPGGDIHIAVDVVRPAVQQYDDGPVGGTGLDVPDVQDPRIDLPQRTERRQRAGMICVRSGQRHFILLVQIGCHRSS